MSARPKRAKVALGPDAAGGYQTKSEYYTPAELTQLKQYIDANYGLIEAGKHQLSTELQTALGMKDPKPRHTSHSVHALIRTLMCPPGLNPFTKQLPGAPRAVSVPGSTPGSFRFTPDPRLNPPAPKRRLLAEDDENNGQAEDLEEEDDDDNDDEGTDNLDVADLSKAARLIDNQVYVPRSWLHDGYLYLAFHRVRGVKVSVGVSPDGYRLTLTFTYPELKPRDLHVQGSYLSSSRPEFSRSAHFRVPEGARVAPASEWLDCANEALSLLRFHTIPDAATAHLSETKQW